MEPGRVSPSVSPCTSEDEGKSPAGATMRDPRQKTAKGAGKAAEVSLQPAKPGKGAVLKAKEPKAAAAVTAPVPKVIAPKAAAKEPLNAEASSPAGDGSGTDPGTDGNDKLRAALQALKARRIDLDEAHRQLDEVRQEATSLSGQLQATRVELAAEKEAKASALSSSANLQSQLSSAKVELEGVQKAKAAVTLELEGKTLQVQKLQQELEQATKALTAELQSAKTALSSSKSQLEGLKKAKAAADQEAASLRTQLAKTKSDLEVAKRAESSWADEAAVLKSKLASTTADLEEAQKGKAAKAADCEVAQAQLRACKVEVEELRKARAAMTDETNALRAELGAVRADLAREQEAKVLPTKEVEALKQQLSALRSELAKAQRAEAAAAQELQQLQLTQANGGSVGKAVKNELEAAWEEFTGSGLSRLQKAMAAAGFKVSSSDRAGGPLARRGIAKSQSMEDLESLLRDADTGKAAPSRPSTEKRGKREKAVEQEKPREERGRREKGEKRERERKDKKEKKERKLQKVEREEEDAVEPGEGQEDSGEDIEVPELDPSSFWAAAPAPTDSSPEPEQQQQVDEHRNGARRFVPQHRTLKPAGPSCLRTRRGDSSSGSARKGSAASRVTFSHEELQVDVRSYRNSGELLWSSNPQFNVMCERCQKRVPQRLGILRGGSGGSSFACDQFVCMTCLSEN